MRGAFVWHAHPTLSRPLTVLGVERRWFFLTLTFALAIFQTLRSIVTAALVFGTLYGLGLIAWRRDPAMLLIVRAAANGRARYDPGKPPKWHVELVE